MNQATRPSPPGLCGSEPSSFSGTTWSPVVACQMGGTSQGSQRHLASCVVIYELGTRTLLSPLSGGHGPPGRTDPDPHEARQNPVHAVRLCSIMVATEFALGLLRSVP